MTRNRSRNWHVLPKSSGHATRNDIVDDIVNVSSSTMAFNVAKIASAHASLTISLTKSLRVAGPLLLRYSGSCISASYGSFHVRSTSVLQLPPPICFKFGMFVDI